MVAGWRAGGYSGRWAAAILAAVSWAMRCSSSKQLGEAGGVLFAGFAVEGVGEIFGAFVDEFVEQVHSFGGHAGALEDLGAAVAVGDQDNVGVGDSLGGLVGPAGPFDDDVQAAGGEVLLDLGEQFFVLGIGLAGGGAAGKDVGGDLQLGQLAGEVMMESLAAGNVAVTDDGDSEGVRVSGRRW